MMKNVADLTEDEFNALKDLGFLWEFYPDAPNTWKEIPGNKTYVDYAAEGIVEEIDKKIMNVLVAAVYNEDQDSIDATNHMKLVKEIELINVEDGHNKIWIGELYDNNTVITRWGKIGYGLQSKMITDAGEEFFYKKIKEKKRKGYAENSV